MKKYYKGWITKGCFSGETEKAVGFDGWFSSRDQIVWFPKSQIKFGEEIEGTNNREIFIPVWLFISKAINPENVNVRWDYDGRWIKVVEM